jgi:hypothetical protein
MYTSKWSASSYTRSSRVERRCLTAIGADGGKRLCQNPFGEAPRLNRIALAGLMRS